jgi:hypothetical protein
LYEGLLVFSCFSKKYAKIWCLFDLSYLWAKIILYPTLSKKLLSYTYPLQKGVFCSFVIYRNNFLISLNYSFMLSINRKIYKILKINFGIQQTKISDNTNLIQAFNLCDWELELLYYKIENAFNIEITDSALKDEVSFKKLKDEVYKSLYHYTNNTRMKQRALVN